ncbi:SGNH/GDSL hydrolase family protein [Metabacillus bambusae]|uniref:SGNH/GDSL hydrolase family protein n=1 Tax=Metabacillus bambusae TaxID=2795218 RepID=A0ABS3N133_9BACI|nr:SGNH/GDSL hydrolase family protein [Metabacillus bambusae]MBO1511780.1 SGNH/GDSL hydrolase family protein [Metabacillus bambusae]
MKKLLVLVTLIVCVAAIILGNLHWNNKISTQGAVTSTSKSVSLKEEPEEEKIEIDVSKYASNLPKDLQEKISNASSTGKQLKLVIFGTSDEKGAWSDQFSEELKATYGENVFEVTVLSTGDKTTLDVIKDQSYEGINELSPDILLFEPSMLKDNGLIGIENTLDNIQKMIDSWKAENEDMTLMIQPPNPLYDATYYPSEVSQLKAYAEENDMIYLNHWENWPDLDDVKMKDYLTESKANESGNKVWADYLLNYFIAE